MNQILISEKIYVTPELKRKKRIYKIYFFLAVFLVFILSSYYIYAEYDRNKNEEQSREILSSLSFSSGIEDDTTINVELKEMLDNAGYEGVILKDFDNSLDEITNINPDLILLDINIPKINGQMLLKELRKSSNIPVIMVTSRKSEVDEVLSMSYGADDYVTKPYNPTLLLLKINAVLKRTNIPTNFINYHGVKVIQAKGIIKKDDLEIILTKNEMIILNCLLNNIGNIVTRDDLMTDLWNNKEYINDNALSVNISRLRSKLKEAGIDDAIETRKGQGYILK